MLGIRTRGCRMVGADKTTELWWPPMLQFLSHFLKVRLKLSAIHGILFLLVSSITVSIRHCYKTAKFIS